MVASFTPLIALLLYLTAHALRCARLYVLSLGARRGGARLVVAHCLTAWPNAIIPFKLGELIRIASFGLAVRSPGNGLAIWLVERLSDAIVLIVLTLGFSWLFPVGHESDIVLAVTVGFVIFCAFGAWMAVELVPFLRNELLYRSRSPKGLWLLRLVDNLERAIASGKTLLIGRFSATLLVAFLIWLCDFGAIALWRMSSQSEIDSPLDLFAMNFHEIEERAPVFLVIGLVGLSILSAIVVRNFRRA